MGLEYILGVPAAVLLGAFAVYLGGRLFGLGFSASVKQANTTKETTRGTRQ